MTTGQEESIMTQLERAARRFGAADIALNETSIEDEAIIDEHDESYAALLDLCRHLTGGKPEARP